MEELKRVVSSIGDILSVFLGEGLPERVVSPAFEIFLTHLKQGGK